MNPKLVSKGPKKKTYKVLRWAMKLAGALVIPEYSKGTRPA